MSYEGMLLMSGVIVRWPLTVVVEPEDLAIPFALTAKAQAARRPSCAHPGCRRPATHTTRYYGSDGTAEAVGYCARHPGR